MLKALLKYSHGNSIKIFQLIEKAIFRPDPKPTEVYGFSLPSMDFESDHKILIKGSL